MSDAPPMPAPPANVVEEVASVLREAQRTDVKNLRAHLYRAMMSADQLQLTLGGERCTPAEAVTA